MIDNKVEESLEVCCRCWLPRYRRKLLLLCVRVSFIVFWWVVGKTTSVSTKFRFSALQNKKVGNDKSAGRVTFPGI